MITAIQSGTATAASSMKRGVDRFASGAEQAAASTEIVRNVERNAQMAEENNIAAASNATTANSLRELAEMLSSELARFRT